MTHTENFSALRRAPIFSFLLAASALIFLLPTDSGARPQSARPPAAKKPAPAITPQPALLKRTTTRSEVRRLGYGGSVTIYGAPEGSITVEAWSRSEVEITTDVELSAETEEELSRLAAINGFVIDEDYNHIRVVTTGTHDRKYLKRVARDLPKKLIAMPWKVDYRLKVPAAVDLEIYGGRGPLAIAGVEGAIRLYAPTATGATFTLAGGDVEATVGGGPVNVRVPMRNWRGRGMNLRLAIGDLTVELPANFSGDIDAQVLSAGRVENTFTGLAPRERTKPTERLLEGRAGQGGATLSFTVGSGTLRIKQEGSKQ
ncbi:MAG: hypothetical protein LC802_23695 [Acidobacteria bacterium]|nr:hypothetical protein [Acidobacteriota bacterium]